MAPRVIEQETRPLSSYDKVWYAQYYAQNRVWLLAAQREYERKINLTLMDILGGRECKFW